ncbi:hypothetical protein [Streptomyces sp. NPDC018045]
MQQERVVAFAAGYFFGAFRPEADIEIVIPDAPLSHGIHTGRRF